jgi:hypothetical protein
MYNIYLDSPQLAVQANRKKQYQKQIKRFNQFLNRPFPKKYGKYYGETIYQRIITYNESNNPGY